jgi:hypothetical protein
VELLDALSGLSTTASASAQQMKDEIPLSRQLPLHCPRNVSCEEVTDEYGATYWKVTIGGKSALLCFDEMLAAVATYTRPHGLNGHPLFWRAFQSDAEREYEDRIRQSHYRLKHLGCLKESQLDTLW